MKVYKFGGASVRNADGVQNLLKIIGDERDLFIIVSAMGKTTNALEKVFEGLQKGDKAFSMEHITALRQYHAEIVNELYGAPTRLEKIERLFGELEQVATETVYRPEDAELWYDTVVAFGELISTTIISEYLSERGIDNCWLDMRRCFRTEQRHKDASVDIAASRTLLRNAMKQSKACIFIGQGFIGGAPDGTTTTLGREGSDYSAAVAANILDAESMSVWKDVDGILITHEHSDHIKGLGVISRKYGIPIYTTGGTADAMLRMKSLGKMPEGLIHEIREDEPFEIKDLTVNPFTIPHDAAQPVGYRLECGEHSVGIATDLVKNLENLDAVLLEANHDIRMLQVGKYPYYLKQRILGDRGHLSNENAGRLLCRILHDNLKAVFLGHLSRENNYEELAYETVCSEVTLGDNPYRSRDFKIQVAKRDHISEIITV